MSPPKVLVTGAQGFIGSHVVAALSARGANIVELVRPTDYHDAAAVERLLERETPAVLVHSAWRLAPGSDYLADPQNADEVVASLQLFMLARDAGCTRILGLGTCLEYEESDAPVTETAPLRPRSAYAASKASLFLAADAWARRAGVGFAWARLYFPYGPREAPHRLIPSVVNGLLRGERVATTAGAQRRSFLYAADVGDALAALALSDVTGAVNVGAADAIEVRTVVERIGALLGRANLLDVGARSDRPGDPVVLWPNVGRLQSEVGWQPARDLDSGLTETIAWWRERS